MNIIDELKELGEEINLAKKELNTDEGRKQELMSRLEKEFEVKSVRGGDRILAKLNEEIETETVEIEKEFSKLKEDFKW